jgi:hypothetical protein
MAQFYAAIVGEVGLSSAGSREAQCFSPGFPACRMIPKSAFHITHYKCTVSGRSLPVKPDKPALGSFVMIPSTGRFTRQCPGYFSLILGASLTKLVLVVDGTNKPELTNVSRIHIFIHLPAISYLIPLCL